MMARPSYTPELIHELRLRVISHNKACQGPPVKLNELKIRYTRAFSHTGQHDKALAKIDSYLAGLAKAADNSSAILEQLAINYLGIALAGAALQNVLANTARYRAGHEAYGRPASRRDKLEAAAKAARRLHAHLLDIDPRLLLQAIGPAQLPLDGRPPETVELEGLKLTKPVFSRAPELLERLGICLDVLGSLARGLPDVAAAQGEIRRGAPETPDPLMFGIEGLAHLWARHHGAPPSTVSAKHGQFGAFVFDALALLTPPFHRAEIGTALRHFGEANRQRAAQHEQ
ncbi:conserved protein of unknown function (plasmid) [Rhodovastum atsumiense]|uniref:Uncharacterized protein n=1 Tax=Rhodovastum atsumiense TaxID=504468 RepID=A0A5M6IM36_9PROT|nr:hypothetical protein [Rhodovastum atsumiense]KAA5608628.1 hypothetical protein F1189_28110 [Rhodovastum atsumiense]CAH2605982.1 conserved protein of unknown function [Rhodovastum atsumiense]